MATSRGLGAPAIRVVLGVALVPSLPLAAMLITDRYVKLARVV